MRAASQEASNVPAAEQQASAQREQPSGGGGQQRSGQQAPPQREQPSGGGGQQCSGGPTKSAPEPPRSQSGSPSPHRTAAPTSTNIRKSPLREQEPPKPRKKSPPPRAAPDKGEKALRAVLAEEPPRPSGRTRSTNVRPAEIAGAVVPPPIVYSSGPVLRRINDGDSASPPTDRPRESRSRRHHVNSSTSLNKHLFLPETADDQEEDRGEWSPDPHEEDLRHNPLQNTTTSSNLQSSQSINASDVVGAVRPVAAADHDEDLAHAATADEAEEPLVLLGEDEEDSPLSVRASASEAVVPLDQESLVRPPLFEEAADLRREESPKQAPSPPTTPNADASEDHVGDEDHRSPVPASVLLAIETDQRRQLQNDYAELQRGLHLLTHVGVALEMSSAADGAGGLPKEPPTNAEELGKCLAALGIAEKDR